MVVDGSTFAKLPARAVHRNFGDLEPPIPRTLELVALKLHALRSAGRAAQGKDLPEFMALLRSANLGLSDPGPCAILDRYATDETRSEIHRQLSGNGD